MRSLFLIGRHGETFLNEDGRYRGLSNGPDAQLNDDGRKSAHDLGKFTGNLGQEILGLQPGCRDPDPVFMKGETDKIIVEIP